MGDAVEHHRFAGALSVATLLYVGMEVLDVFLPVVGVLNTPVDAGEVALSVTVDLTVGAVVPVTGSVSGYVAP